MHIFNETVFPKGNKRTILDLLTIAMILALGNYVNTDYKGFLYNRGYIHPLKNVIYLTQNFMYKHKIPRYSRAI